MIDSNEKSLGSTVSHYQSPVKSYLDVKSNNYNMRFETLEALVAYYRLILKINEDIVTLSLVINHDGKLFLHHYGPLVTYGGRRDLFIADCCNTIEDSLKFIMGAKAIYNDKKSPVV